jgi:hypothetical protein
MPGGSEGVTVTMMSDDGALPQPHINIRIEITSPSFFIIYAFPLP